ALAALRAEPDPARLAMRHDAEARAKKDHEAAVTALHDARRTRDAAQGGTEAARAAQDRATAMASLSEGARRAAAQLLGHLAGKAALSRLVAEHRGPMVDAASEAFSRITCGEWDGLDVFGPNGMAVAARAGDRRAPVAGLSEGTRAQLFLALRVAGHAAFCERHGPLPFVTDDILEAFDDTRAEAALRMAGEMGRRGQVVFFTHHPHIAALARAAIPGVGVVEMPRRTH
ncbi:MAG: ATP-binding protein, partial [Shimia sp.]